MDLSLAVLLTLLGIISPPFSPPLYVTAISDSPPFSPPLNVTAFSDKLREDFYEPTCPNVQQIIADTIQRKSKENSGIIPGIIRLHFHDCFITGCDGSILLTPQRYNSYNVEMAHPANGKSLRGMDALDAAKAEVEKQCPGVVSCADILAYAARDAIVLSGNPHYNVPAGRRDSFNTDGSLASGLPKGNESIAMLQEKFASRGLSLGDLVVLEGSHSIGQTRCQLTIADDGAMDNMPEVAKWIDKPFQQMVKQKFCPEAQKALFWNLTAPLIPEKPDNSAWGNTFYQYILRGKTLLPSDNALAIGPTTKDMVQLFASDNAQWQSTFNDAMIKLGKINVLTGDQGEIRRHCGWINAVDMA